MTVSGQFSCPPAGNFVAVSEQFPVSADSRALDSAPKSAVVTPASMNGGLVRDTVESCSFSSLIAE